MFPNKGEQNQKWLPYPCLLGGPKEGGNATSPLHTRGSPNKGGQNQKWLVPPAFLGAHKWAEMLRHPCILGDPQKKGGGEQKWVPHPCLLGSPKKGGNATSPSHSWGSLAKGTKSKVAELGARTKLWMCSPKEYHQKKISQKWCVCVEKHP